MTGFNGSGGSPNYLVKGVLAILGLALVGGVYVFSGGVKLGAGDYVVTLSGGTQTDNRTLSVPTLADNGTLFVANESGQVNLSTQATTDTTENTGDNTGVTATALHVLGGAAVEKKLWAGGDIQAGGAVTAAGSITAGADAPFGVVVDTPSVATLSGAALAFTSDAFPGTGTITVNGANIIVAENNNATLTTTISGTLNTGPIYTNANSIDTGGGNIDTGGGGLNLASGSVTNATQFLAVNGSGTTPSFSFGSDPDTGFFLGSEGMLVFTADSSETMTIINSNVGINGTPTLSDGSGLDINGNLLRIRSSKTPSSSSATGNAGEICWDADYLYICIDTNTWRRIAHSTW